MPPPDPPPGAAILNALRLCPPFHASGPPFMQFLLTEHLSCPPHLLAHHQHLSSQPGPLLQGIRQDGECDTTCVLTPALPLYCAISGKLPHLSVSQFLMGTHEDDCPHGLLGGCGELGVCLHVGSSAEHQVLLPSEPAACGPGR